MQAALCGARVHAIHVGKFRHCLAAGFVGAQQGFFACLQGSQFGQGLGQHGVGGFVAGVHAFGVFLARQAAGLDIAHDARHQFGPQILAAPALAAAVHLQQCLVDVLGGHGFYRLALQIVALAPFGNAVQVAGGACMDAQGQFQRFALKQLGVCGQQVLEDAALERQKHCAKELRVQLGQLFQRGRHGPWRAGRLGLAIGLRRTGTGCGTCTFTAAAGVAARGVGGRGRALRAGGSVHRPLVRGRAWGCGGSGGLVRCGRGIGHGRAGEGATKPSIMPALAHHAVRRARAEGKITQPTRRPAPAPSGAPVSRCRFAGG